LILIDIIVKCELVKFLDLRFPNWIAEVWIESHIESQGFKPNLLLSNWITDSRQITI